jgi:AraC family L-rhamnose operon transcriptional activator RhaR
MIDFRLQGAGRQAPSVCSLTRSELAQIRQHLARLRSFHAGAGRALRLEGAVAILQVFITLLRAAGWIERVPTRISDGPTQAILDLLAKMDHVDSLAAVVQRSGYQRDHLNRLIKKATGLTLGQYRTQRRLAKAKELLSQGMQVAAVGAVVGLPDQSYFARWFRRQTGQRPSTWIRHGLS